LREVFAVEKQDGLWIERIETRGRAVQQLTCSYGSIALAPEVPAEFAYAGDEFRSGAANAAANTTIAVEYGSNLDGWTAAVHDGTDIITETPGSPTATLEVKLRRTLAASGKLFFRLHMGLAVP